MPVETAPTTVTAARGATQLEERIAAGLLREDNDLVFAQPNGRPAVCPFGNWQFVVR